MKFLHKISPVLFFLFIAFFLFSYFRIDGREINNIKKLHENCDVSVIMTQGNEQTEYQLSGQQILELKELLRENHYTRRLSRTIIGVLPDTEYNILADWNDNGKTHLYLRIMGNEYIYIEEFMGSNWHKINNPTFEQELKNILTQ